MKCLSCLLALFLFTGCATTGAGDYYLRADGSNVDRSQKDTDANSCRQNIMMVASIPLFVLAALPGLALLLSAHMMEVKCMEEKGYITIHETNE